MKKNNNNSGQNKRKFPFESPSQKSERYAVELSLGDNAFTGQKLDAKQASYRMGYLNARKQASKARQAYKRKHGNK